MLCHSRQQSVQQEGVRLAPRLLRRGQWARVIRSTHGSGIIMMSLWRKQLSVGNRILDSEHKNLLGIIKEVSRSIVARDAAASVRGFEQLEDCLCAYFAVEERIAQAVGFDFIQHRLAHRHLLDEAQRVRNELTAGNCMCPGDGNYARRLMDCLIQHIKEDSRPLKIVLDTHLYDFNP